MSRVLWTVCLGAVCGLLFGAATWADEPVSDAEFAKKASADSLAEINLGQFMQAQATNAGVKTYAARLAADHKQANEQLLKIANKEGLTLAREMDEHAQHAITKLSKATGKERDEEFVKCMVKDHEKAIKLFEHEAKHGKNAALRTFAEQTLPTLRTHLQMAERLSGQDKTKEAR